MIKKPAYRVEFWARANSTATQPLSWQVNHDGPLNDVKMAAQGTLNLGTFPDAVRFTIHDNQTGEEVYSGSVHGRGGIWEPVRV